MSDRKAPPDSREHRKPAGSRWLLGGLLALFVGAYSTPAGGQPRTPGTPAPDPRPAPGPIGGSGSGRWQFASLTGLYVVDPAAGEIAIQGIFSGSLPLVHVDYNKGVPPADTVVKLNGVPLVRWSGNPLLQWTVDPTGPQPIVGSGGFLTIEATSASAGTQRQLVLPCPADVAMTTIPPVGSSLAGVTSVPISFASNIVLNPPGIAGLAGVFPTATLLGYDPATGSIPSAVHGEASVGAAGTTGVTVPIVTPTSTTRYLMDVRWQGPWQPDGETGAFCGLAKRWTYEAGPAVREEVVPVVARLQGRSLYTSELMLTNTGATALNLTLAFTSANTGAAPAVTESLAAGQQLAIGDVIGYLLGRGLSIGAEDVGTLRVTDSATGATPRVSLQARTTSPSGIGRAGVGYSAASTESLGNTAVAIYGLREDLSDRSNLALENAGTAGPATYRVTLTSGDPGDGRRVALTPDVTLQPGEWKQFNGVLGQAGMANGYATVERITGIAPFLAYGVVNDNGTNDGSFLEMSGTALPAETLIIPAVAETPVFETGLTLTNPGAGTLVVTLSYVESLSSAAVPANSVTVTLSPGEQRNIPGIVDFLRSQSAGIGPRGASYAGSLKVAFTAAGVPAAGWAGGRVTAAAASGGRYGLSYAGVPLSRAATAEALVTGLRQDSETRSNLALVNAGALGQPLTLRYDVYDGVSALMVGQSAPLTLQPGEWKQINGVLAPWGVTNGWVRVVKLSGDDRFIAYGVVNDGATSTSGTNDGTYVAMSGVR